MMKKILSLLFIFTLLFSLAACSLFTGTPASQSGNTQSAVPESAVTEQTETGQNSTGTASDATGEESSTVSEVFTDRDLEQTADLSEAETITLSDGQDVTVTEEGVYVLQGSAKEVTITVQAGDQDKVQLVLDGVTITNETSPCIAVLSADKVFVTTTEDSENVLSVTGTFVSDSETNYDAVIFSKEDLVLNGLGLLAIGSSDNGITCKDELKVTGGTLMIQCVSDALEANDSVSIAGGTITIESSKDGVHVEYDEDDSVGSFLMTGGSLSITAADDAIHATTMLEVEGGSLSLTAGECLEATIIRISGGTLNLNASDDAVNASSKSTAYSPIIEISGGDITINMGQGDTDAVDSNGDLVITGGTLNINAQSPFDYDGNCSWTGGTITVNGSEITSISNQIMGGMGAMGQMDPSQMGEMDQMGGPGRPMGGGFGG